MEMQRLDVRGWRLEEKRRINLEETEARSTEGTETQSGQTST